MYLTFPTNLLVSELLHSIYWHICILGRSGSHNTVLYWHNKLAWVEHHAYKSGLFLILKLLLLDLPYLALQCAVQILQVFGNDTLMESSENPWVVGTVVKLKSLGSPHPRLLVSWYNSVFFVHKVLVLLRCVEVLTPALRLYRLFIFLVRVKMFF